MINSVKSIIIAASALAMSVFAAMPSSAQEKVVRYEGSVSVGAGYFEYREVGGVLHTSHGIRFNREGVRFLYLGLSLEEQLYLGGRPYIPSYTFLSVHAKTYFPAGARVQATAGLELGAMRLAAGSVMWSPNLTPSIGVEFLTKGKQAVMITARTYINKDSVTGEQPDPGVTLIVGYRF